MVTLGSLPDKVGLFGRRKDAAASRILQGRDSRSVRFLVPHVRGVDQNFHDVTIVDMDEEREPKVTAGDLIHLRDSWPPGIFNHMTWFQQDLELMRKEAKRELTQARPMPCRYCGKVQYRGVPCGEVHHRIVWNICGTVMMFRGYRRQPASNDLPHHGQCVVKCGRSQCDYNIREYQRIFCCSANSGWR